MTIQLHGVSKSFSATTALHHLDLTLHPGVTAIMGMNGSGKSTLLRLLATAIEPDEGYLTLDGYPYTAHQRAIRQSLGYLPQQLDLPPDMTVKQFICYVASLKGGNPEPILSDLLPILSLADKQQQPLGKLSTGERRLVMLAQACLGQPQLLLLDELTSNLGVDIREIVFQWLRSCSQPGHYIVFSTHNARDADDLARFIVIMRQGRIVFHGTPQRLRAGATGQVHELTIQRDRLSRWTDHYAVTRIQPTAQSQQVTIRIVSDDPPAGATSVTPSLEDAYMYLHHRSAKV